MQPQAQPKIKTELDFLTAIERGEVVTQMTLSKRVGVAVGLINALLKRAARKGYVKAKSAPYKRYAYYLTLKGFAEKSRLVTEYLEVSLGFFRQARGEYAALFARAEAEGRKRLVLAGGGELAEIAVMAARDGAVELVAIIDARTNRERLYGLRVARTLEEAVDEAGPVDGVVIADAISPQETYEELAERLPEDSVLAPPLLRITPDRRALAAKAGKG